MAGTISLNAVAKDYCWDGGIKTGFANGVVQIFGGTATDVDTTITTETVLSEITESGGAFTSGSATNGLNLGNVGDTVGEIEMTSTEDWEGEGDSAGTASWFRHFNNDMTAWIQGSVNTSGAVMTVTTTAITSGVPVTVTTYKLRF